MSNGTTCSTAWLDNNLGNVKILDGSFYLPAENRNADAEFTEAHIKSRSKNSPIVGMRLKGRVVGTISGKYVYGKHFD